MPLNSAALRAIMRQVQDLAVTPLEGVRVEMPEDASTIDALLEGPADTPFAGGAFHVQLVITDEYPSVPPKAFFKTKIFHPNIAEGKGDVCVNTLKKDWLPEYGLRHVLQVIKCLLVEPNAESALNEEAGRWLLEDYKGYCQQAAMITKVHAPRWQQQQTQGGGGNDEQGSGSLAANGPPSTSVVSEKGGLRDLGSANVPTATAAAVKDATTTTASVTVKDKAAEKKKSALRRI